MLISTAHRLAFLHIPKTGGSSITEALAPFLDDPVQYVDDSRGWQDIHHADGQLHSTWADNRDVLAALPADWTVAGFVRNPWSRMTSLYQFVADAGESFGDFVRRFHDRPETIVAAHHTTSMADWLGDATWVGRFERLEADYQALCSRVGIDPPPLPVRMAKKPRPPVRAFYAADPDLVRLVNECWPGDAETFGYSPEM